MDKLSTAQRSANMAAIRSTNTLPEMLVRKAIFNAGLRYRLHDQKLPGKPDIVFAKRRIAVFIHGCFWHGCKKCVDGKRSVKSNTKYWNEKILTNRQRDRKNRKQLKLAGWRVEEIWECETRDRGSIERLIARITTDVVS